jgi:hypothetical protein
MGKGRLASGSIFFHNCFSFRWGLAWHTRYTSLQRVFDIAVPHFSIFGYARANVTKEASVQECMDSLGMGVRMDE